ncbi:molybdopterin-binding protein [Nocardia sp. NPDC059240]|uniref:TOBE domain-containing protein n=1 Tax=Nocardia sp. NPDC059240 TaxID=3346786 RepID=UPI0036B8BEF2
MKLSTRNQLDGTVTEVTRGEAMAVVRIRLAGGDEITSSITRAAADDLALADGKAVKVLIKSTEVSLGVE